MASCAQELGQAGRQALVSAATAAQRQRSDERRPQLAAACEPRRSPPLHPSAPPAPHSRLQTAAAAAMSLTHAGGQGARALRFLDLPGEIHSLIAARLEAPGDR